MSINEDEIKEVLTRYFSIEELFEMNTLLSKIKEPKVLLINTGVQPRVFNSWKNLGLIHGDDTERKWSKFYFPEFLWLKIIQELRAFGVSIEKILEIKKSIFEENMFAQAIQFIMNPANKKDIDANFEKMGAKGELFKNAFKSMMELPELEMLEEFKKANLTITLLDIMILNGVLKRLDNGLIIYSNGTCVPWFDEYYRMDIDTNKILNKPHIYISFQYFIIEFLLDNELDSFLSPLQLLNKEELEILSLIRNNELKEIKIKFSEKGSTPYMLEIVSGKQVSSDEAKQIMKNMVFKNYETITFKTNNNKTVYIEKSVKKIL